MERKEEFRLTTIPDGFYWFNEPARYKFGNGLEICSGEGTDFWQNTHYGFQKDDGHCLLTTHRGDFTLTCHVESRPREQYDQCGLMVRLDRENWIKVSTEYENQEISRLGSVVTNLGYSDWATQDIPSTHTAMWYRISKSGRDCLLESSSDGKIWMQLRMTHLHKASEQYDIGVYACSPKGKDFWCRFTSLEISKSAWARTAG